MKTIAFLSKFAFICNLCFLLFLLFQFLENQGILPDFDRYLATAILRDTLVILGFFSFFVNAILAIIYGIQISRGTNWDRFRKLPLWNMFFLALQVFIYFIF